MNGVAQLMEIPARRADGWDSWNDNWQQPVVYHLDPPLHGCDYVMAISVATSAERGEQVILWECDHTGLLWSDPNLGVTVVLVDRVYNTVDHETAFGCLGYNLVR